MAAKELAKEVGGPDFLRAYGELGTWAKDADGLTQLLAIDLIVRLSSSAKKLRSRAEQLLRAALVRELPPLSLASDTKDLPPEAKPAEVRENVAASLTFASGSWVGGYVIKSLAEEDRSQRCRIELTRRLSVLEPAIDRWFEELLKQPAITMVQAIKGSDAAAAQLRDLLSAIADAISSGRYKLSASERTGPLLARLASTALHVSQSERLPDKLDLTAAELARVLDEVLLVHLSLFSEPQTYAPIEVLYRWWYPRPYPDALRNAISPVSEKILAAIVVLARSGSRSESLLSRFKQAIGDRAESERRLVRLAAEEPSLPVEILDWLTGRRRVTSPVDDKTFASLEVIASEGFLSSLANILLDLEMAWSEATAGGHLVSAGLQRALQRIRVEAAAHGLEVFGRPGDQIQFSSSAHETLDGEPPRDPLVRIVRPMVLRKQSGGAVAVVKALVTNAK
jgi:hypothetical protein